VKVVWGEAKNDWNRKKHGIFFQEAAALLESDDCERLEAYDAEHSESEDRFLAICNVERGTIVLVYSEPADGVVRLISARPATRRERQMFLDYLRGGRR
jgi:uncharacterized DUF497 family protein